MKGRGLRITDQIRAVAEHKLSKIERLDPRLRRVEVEIIGERNPRIDDSHRVEVTCDSAKDVFRAHGAGRDVDTALDEVVERLERQITKRRGRLRNHRASRSDRLE